MPMFANCEPVIFIEVFDGLLSPNVPHHFSGPGTEVIEQKCVAYLIGVET